MQLPEVELAYDSLCCLLLGACRSVPCNSSDALHAPNPLLCRHVRPAEWGHSFRPAYFRLGAALAGSIQAQRVLALTATATRSTEVAIRQVRGGWHGCSSLCHTC